MNNSCGDYIRSGECKKHREEPENCRWNKSKGCHQVRPYKKKKGKQQKSPQKIQTLTPKQQKGKQKQSPKKTPQKKYGVQKSKKSPKRSPPSKAKPLIERIIRSCQNWKCLKMYTSNIFTKPNLPFANPFKITTMYMEDKELLIAVSEILMKCNNERVYDAISLCLKYYVDTSRIGGLLYASSLLSFCLHNYLKKGVVYQIKWIGDEYVNNLSVYKIECENCLQWMFFVLAVTLNAMVTDISVDEIRRRPYSTYSYDIYTSVFNGQHWDLTQNCLFSTLLEAYKYQLMGVSAEKLVVRMQKPVKQKSSLEWKTLKGIGTAEDATHWYLKYDADKFHGYNRNLSMCTQEVIDFKNNKLYIAKTIMYMIISVFKTMIRTTLKRQLISLEYASEQLERTGKLLYKLRLLLESELPKKNKKARPLPLPSEKIAEDYKLDSMRDSAYIAKIGK